jgi:acyl carrier protein
MINFIDLFNAVAKFVRPAHHDYEPFTNENQLFTDSSLDSLDMLMLGIYMCEIYGISEEIGKTMQPTNIAEMKAFISEHKTKDPESIDAALELIK